MLVHTLTDLRTCRVSGSVSYPYEFSLTLMFEISDPPSRPREGSLISVTEGGFTYGVSLISVVVGGFKLLLTYKGAVTADPFFVL